MYVYLSMEYMCECVCVCVRACAPVSKHDILLCVIATQVQFNKYAIHIMHVHVSYEVYMYMYTACSETMGWLTCSFMYMYVHVCKHVQC